MCRTDINGFNKRQIPLFRPPTTKAPLRSVKSENEYLWIVSPRATPSHVAPRVNSNTDGAHVGSLRLWLLYENQLLNRYDEICVSVHTSLLFLLDLAWIR